MFAEPHVAVVKRIDLEAARSGNTEAAARLRQQLHGLYLYTHALTTETDEIAVTIAELVELGVVKGVILDAKGDERCARSLASSTVPDKLPG